MQRTLTGDELDPDSTAGEIASAIQDIRDSSAADARRAAEKLASTATDGDAVVIAPDWLCDAEDLPAGELIAVVDRETDDAVLLQAAMSAADHREDDAHYRDEWDGWLPKSQIAVTWVGEKYVADTADA